MNQKVTWHPEFISSEDLAKVLDSFRESGSDLTLEEFMQTLSWIAPLISGTHQATLFYNWFMDRNRSNKLTQEELLQVFEWMVPRFSTERLEWLRDEMMKHMENRTSLE